MWWIDLFWVWVFPAIALLICYKRKTGLGRFAVLTGLLGAGLVTRIAIDEVWWRMNREPTEATPGVIGQSYQLRLDEDQPERETFRWTSSDTRVVQVDSTGSMTFMSAGYAEICAVSEARLTHLRGFRVYQLEKEMKWWEVGMTMSSVGFGPPASTCITFHVGESLKPPPVTAGGARPTSMMSVVFI